MSSPRMPWLRRVLRALVIGASISALAACGTLFHPERKGQPSGDIDPAVAIANGVGLLFFIVPGVIAYAIDFSNGTLYLPGGDSRAQVATLRLDDSMDVVALEQLLSEQSGKPVSLDSEALKVAEVESLDEALALVRMAGLDDADRLAREAAPASDIM